MSVPKGKRKQSRFEAQHRFFILRQEVTKLIMNSFRFSKEKYEKQIERYRQTHMSAPNVDEVVERWKRKCEEFYRIFIPEEQRVVLEILRKIESEFYFGNYIYTTETHAKIMEFCERRKHIDNAIAECFVLKQELNYIIRTLPVDLNKFARFTEAIDMQVSLYKGVRQADNRLLKPKKKQGGLCVCELVVALRQLGDQLLQCEQQRQCEQQQCEQR